MQEKDRLILGAIMVSETFWGEDCRDGLVKGHKKYRILLPLTLAISFWPYFENEHVHLTGETYRLNTSPAIRCK